MGLFGEKLRKQRELRGVSLETIASSTKISTRMLRAIEEENFDQLPGGVFNKGFVRAYARQVGLDEDDAVADYLIALRESQFQSQAILPNFRQPEASAADLAAAPNAPANGSAQTSPQRVLASPVLNRTSDRFVEFRSPEKRAGESPAVEKLRTEGQRAQVQREEEKRKEEQRTTERRGPDRRKEDGRREDRRTADGQPLWNDLRTSEISSPRRFEAPIESLTPPNLDARDLRNNPAVSPTERPLPRPPWEKLAVALLLLIVVLAMWNYFRRRPQPSEASTPVVTNPAANPAAIISAVTPSVVATPAPAAKVSFPPDKVSPAPSRHNRTPHPTPAPVTIAKTGATKTDATKAATAKFTLVIRASQTSWISIVADGQPVARETLIAPATTSVRATREVVVRAGNAAAISFRLNGKEIPARGSAGEVRTYTFDASGIRNSVAQ